MGYINGGFSANATLIDGPFFTGGYTFPSEGNTVKILSEEVTLNVFGTGGVFIPSSTTT